MTIDQTQIRKAKRYWQTIQRQAALLEPKIKRNYYGDIQGILEVMLPDGTVVKRKAPYLVQTGLRKLNLPDCLRGSKFMSWRTTGGKYYANKLVCHAVNARLLTAAEKLHKMKLMMNSKTRTVFNNYVSTCDFNSAQNHKGPQAKSNNNKDG